MVSKLLEWVVLVVHVILIIKHLGLWPVEPNEVLSMAVLLLWRSVDWQVVPVDTDQLVLDIAVVGSFVVLQLVEVVEDVLHLRDVLRLVPQESLRSLEAPCLDVFDLLHRVLFHFSPYQFLVEEV